MPSDERWRDVKRIASEALDLPAERRADFLARGCSDDLRSDVRDLLESCERASSTPTFLDTPAAEFAAPFVANVERNPFDLDVLRRELAGRYTIERELGRGGMATVYLAYDERHRRQVALKVVSSSPAHLAGSSHARFQREISIAARLTHPHILALHDSGATAECLYYVMPFVPGESLRERIARCGPLSVQDTLRVARDVARALAYAHGQHIVHRDIKPGNILLNTDGDALVADFGVARAVAAMRFEDVSEHDNELAFGTPAYCAPEQSRGERTIDHRTDLYSLGVTIYEMLCGERPGTGKDASTSAEDCVGDAEVSQSLMAQRPDAPPALASLIQRLLAPDPADRPRDASEVLRSLDVVISGDSAGSVTVAPRSFARRGPVVLATVTSLVLVGGLLSVALRGSGSSPTASRGTDNPEAWQAYVRGTSLDDERPRNLQAAQAYFAKAIELDPKFAGAWAGLASVYTFQAIFDPNLERPDEVVSKAKEAVTRALALDSDLVEANDVRAHQLFVFECRKDDAETAFLRTLALDSSYAPARSRYGLFLHFTGRHDAALAQLRKARDLEPATGAETLLGRVFVNIGQPDSAILYLRNALSFRRDLDIAYQQLAFAWLEKGMGDSAIAAMRSAAELNGRDSAHLAYVYATSGNRAEARRIVQRLVSTESRRHLPVPGMAMAFGALGDIDEAFRRLETGSCEVGLGVSPGFRSLQSDPRFADLRRRKGLR